MRIPTPPALSLVFTAALTLSACGGGGGEAAPAATVITPEGAYSGTLTGSPNPAFTLLMLENNEFWALYGASSAGVFGVSGFVQGSGTATDTSFNATNVKDFGFAPAKSATLSASYNASAGTISGTLNDGGALVGVSGNRIPAATYDYNTAATLATVTGAWTLQALTGETVTLTIAADGAFSGSTSLACNFTGSLVPRPSGKNVFNLSLTFGTSPCALPGQTATGVGLTFTLTDGRRQLLVAGTNAARTEGIAAVGIRP